MQTTLATAVKTEAAQIQSPRIHPHKYNLLLFLQKARAILRKYHDTYFVIKKHF